MYNILKTADHRVKGMKIGTLGPMNCIYVGCFSCLFDFSLWSFGVLCKVSNVKSFKSLQLRTVQFSFNFNQTYCKYVNHGVV